MLVTTECVLVMLIFTDAAFAGTSDTLQTPGAVDWTSDGTIDHVMIVVGVLVSDSGIVDPIIDQKTNNRYQITLHQSIAYAAQAGHKNLTWYGLQYNF